MRVERSEEKQSALHDSPRVRTGWTGPPFCEGDLREEVARYHRRQTASLPFSSPIIPTTSITDEGSPSSSPGSVWKLGLCLRRQKGTTLIPSVSDDRGFRPRAGFAVASGKQVSVAGVPPSSRCGLIFFLPRKPRQVASGRPLEEHGGGGLHCLLEALSSACVAPSHILSHPPPQLRQGRFHFADGETEARGRWLAKGCLSRQCPLE